MSEKNSSTVKLITILDYVSVFCLLGLIVERSDEDVKFHTNQGLMLAILEICGGAFFAILGLLPVIGGVLSVIGALFAVLCTALSVLGVIHAIRGERKPLPLIGTVFNMIR